MWSETNCNESLFAANNEIHLRGSRRVRFAISNPNVVHSNHVNSAQFIRVLSITHETYLEKHLQ